MKKTKGKFEYSFTPSKDYIRETCDLPAAAKLAWLEEANKSVYGSVPKSRRKDWQKLVRER